MKKIIISILALLIYASTQYVKITDNYIRNRVVLLTGNSMSCTGVQIKAPSGRVYTLSAAHCRILATDSKIYARSENGMMAVLWIVDVDVQHDLMILSSATNKSIDVASDISNHQQIHTITHGAGFPSYRTDGELLGERDIVVNIEEITSDEDFKNCPISPYSGPALNENGLFCAHRLTVEMSSAMVVGGSSGGPALNSRGQLIGIVSISNGYMFSGFVPLHFIQDFLKGR